MLWTREYKHNPIVRKIFIAMLAPTIMMNLTTAIGSMADTVIIGHYLDDISLSVVTFATPIYMVINMLAALFAVGGCIAMSVDSGKGERETANKAFSLAMELLVITGVLLMLAGMFFIDSITVWLGAGNDVFELVRLYARIVLLGGPVFVLNVGFAFFVRNDGRPTLSMVGMFLSIIVDICLNVVFVGFLGWGVAGAAWSTVLGQLVSVLVIATHFFSKKNTLRFHFCFDGIVLRIIKNGGSAALHFVYQFLTILIMNHLLSRLAGTNGVVIYTVVFNLSTVSLSLFEGISQTIQPMISVYYGEKSYHNMKETLRLALITILIICGSVTLILEIAPQIVPVVFGLDDVLLIQKSATAVRIYATSMIIMTVNVVIGYYLQSTEKNAIASLMVSLRSFVLFLGCTFVLGKLFGMNGIWAAYTVAEVITFVIILFMIRGERNVLKKKGICLTYLCQEDDYQAFQKAVCSQIADLSNMEEYIQKDAQQYLKVLEACSQKVKGKYIEVEINREDGKLIIRDNLDHGVLSTSIEDALQNGSKADYGPVLGWNRICLE